IYDQFESDYLRATARVMLQELSKESFWKHPPPEMEEIESRLIAFARNMAGAAWRLGVYVSRTEFERTAQAGGFTGAWSQRPGGNGRPRREPQGRPAARHQGYFEVLGLTPGASLLDVKSAYRRKVKETHPDQGGTVQGFLKLQEAYEVLLTEVF
ncbi:MAG TPA: DnaJ domain-containing protein, partial [bacterium]